MATCPHCHQTMPPSLSEEAYLARTLPRLQAIDLLATKINFSLPSWELTTEGERYKRLMAEQSADEVVAGL